MQLKTHKSIRLTQNIGFLFIPIIASGSSKTETETEQIASTEGPIDTTNTDESTVSSSLNNDKSPTTIRRKIIPAIATKKKTKTKATKIA